MDIGKAGVFAGDWAWQDRDGEVRIPVGFIGILLDWWNGFAVFSCDRDVAEAIVADQRRLREEHRRYLEAEGVTGSDLAAQLDEAFAPMTFEADAIVLDERAAYGEEDGISRIAPDEHGRYVVNGWRWTWQIVDPSDCDQIAGTIPAAPLAD
ncbi:hypothetical protein WEI85_00465 [Actinomycetes bacterium KLBMP 9797]